ncbi:hypothetical protein HDU97_008124, partial [Phlyctochytrium planicorne]
MTTTTHIPTLILLTSLLITLLCLPTPTHAIRDPSKNTTFYLVNCHISQEALTSCLQSHPQPTTCSQLQISASGYVGVISFTVPSRGWSMGLTGDTIPSNEWGQNLTPMIPDDHQTLAQGQFRWPGRTWRFKALDGYDGETITVKLKNRKHTRGGFAGTLTMECTSGDVYCEKKYVGGVNVYGDDLSYVYASKRRAYFVDLPDTDVKYYCYR